MSEIRSALGGATAQGYVTVEETGPLGMIALRAALGDPALAAALTALGLEVPQVRRIVLRGDRAAGWMSPDELLLVLPYSEVPAALAALGAALSGVHHLATDVSDARAVFRIRGAAAREVLAKLCPVDLSPAAFGPGDLRRTRAAQVACAFWMPDDDSVTLVCFRSVAAYVMGLLTNAATPGAEVGLY